MPPQSPCKSRYVHDAFSLSAVMVFFPLSIFLTIFFYRTVAPLFFVVLFFLLGHILCRFFGKYGQRAFRLTFILCFLISSLSKAIFSVIPNIPVPDTIWFYRLSTSYYFDNFSSMKHLTDGSLAVFIWNHLYRMNVALGFKNEPFIGILFNCFLVGISAGMTIGTAQYIIGSNTGKLRLLGNLFSVCGIFWLYGALHVRDSFSLFFHTLLLYGLVRVLAVTRMRDIFLLSIIVVLTMWSMNYIREEGTALIAAFCIMGLVSWMLSRFRGRDLYFLIAASLLVVVILSFLFAQYITSIWDEMAKLRVFYLSLSDPTSTLYSVLAGLPLPVRLIIGSLYLHLSPVPLWKYFTLTSLNQEHEYRWLMGYHGIYMAVITPFVLVGLYTTLRRTIRGSFDAPHLCFLILLATSTLLAVAMTSLSPRHYGQFLPAFLILSLLPDYESPRIRSYLTICCTGWYGIVIGVHYILIVWKGI